MIQTIQLISEQDTIDLAAYVAPLLVPGDVISLYGNLGAGKTFFAKQLGRSLGVLEEIDSPSFVLFKEYHCGRIPLYHLDLFRLKTEGELLDLGIFDMIEDGITLIEWPELAENLLPYQSLNLHFSYDGFQRKVEITGEYRFLSYFQDK
ncbi:MAG: tRNA (adenosine(37)-N6)-threonylcarbamoyltransferase complex ATPase subunit type 1 TsaE [Candidatus Cloacimonadaceae bacterium]|nr:tRNA (adenosine(37)-N6)-threonylcarbamoyltransferase complex ATPase subunit type 1 TsaE [Candidatus Cloacimonadaceae bacterium]MDP3113766.1 tRNA (adenosine(37)-N6)-threonylcarbamoyltransferase complex ATPase subunit type 1 TsaE [Candidatus Cloacimonadaceae bacterium]